MGFKGLTLRVQGSFLWFQKDSERTPTRPLQKGSFKGIQFSTGELQWFGVEGLGLCRRVLGLQLSG